MKNIFLTLALCLVFSTTGFAQQEKVETRIGTLEFEKGYPSQKSVEKLFNEIDFQRACQAYIWGLPMTATEAFVESFKKDLGGQWGDLIEVKHSKIEVTGSRLTQQLITCLRGSIFQKQGQ